MKALVFASLFSLGVLGVSSGPSHALQISPSTPALSGAQDLLQEVAKKSDRRKMRKSWDRKRDGDRCRSRNDRCRHYRHGYWYETPWWTLPLISGTIILDSVDRNYSSRHVNWCEDRYRSYNRRTNTWVSYGVAIRQCISPYGP
ncbi:BA14K family protein [Aestuariivirga sp.]|uniref:BA14K family protein n=1 Tax=Aestuariivirga sp. TaxID=2650926 RepID=UPI00391D4A1B